jgi:hypothetical protein
MMRSKRPLAVAVIVMGYLPLVAFLAFVGYAVSWKIPAALLLWLGFMWYRARRTGFRTMPAGTIRTTSELLAFALLGSLVGGLLFGGLGVSFGFVVGFIGRFSEIPVTRRRVG